MSIDDFLKKHNISAYRLGKITKIGHSQITRYRKGEVPLAEHYSVFLDALSFAMEHGYRPAGLEDGRIKSPQ